MVTYQIQYKDSNYTTSTVSVNTLGIWRVVSEFNSLDAALSSAKVLIGKYGYDKIRICRTTNMNVVVELDS